MRKYFTGFYFQVFNTQIWEKGIKFSDLSIPNFILLKKKSLKGFKFLEKSNVLYKYLTLFHGLTEDTKLSLPV